MNILSSNQLMAIYNILQNIIANIDTILGNRCMKKIQPLLDEGRFKEALTEINLFFGSESEYSVAKYLCIFPCQMLKKNRRKIKNNYLEK